MTTDQRVTLILIAMITLVVSAIVIRVSQFSQVFSDIEFQWGRKFMEDFISIAPFTGVISLFVINIQVVFLLVPSTEAHKLVVQTAKYVIYKVAFIPFVVPPTYYQARLWSAWMIVLFPLKMFLDVASDRIHQLNASPSATPWTYFTLLVHLIANSCWMCTQKMYQTFEPSPVGLLLFFEPLSIFFQTLHAILVHGFQLIEYIRLHSPRNNTNSRISELLHIDIGFLWERKRVILRDVGFFFDILSLLMSVGHYVKIWQLHGMTFNLFDAMIFLPILILLSAIMRRTWKFITDLAI